LRHDGNLNISTGGHLVFQVQLLQTTATDPLLSQVEPSATVGGNRKNGERTVPIRSTLKEHERKKSSRQRRRSTRILSKADELVIKLREERGMKWKEIGKYFPTRSVGPLQGRYYSPRRRLAWQMDLIVVQSFDCLVFSLLRVMTSPVMGLACWRL
jgi:hypothetical protein